ncbi:type II CAAX prenyl endopeptidase Rce1 family protein [Streptosporangium sp. DT93]|uniref:CPBP family glutamic-type intramembrane protease n=1 Tax=Streptosporangium sp. DT93 TaxID=3393428 RepID=UPI003CEE7A82
MSRTLTAGAGAAIFVISRIAARGVFGLMQGCLWARYRNIWAIILVHVLTDLVHVGLLMGR